MLNTDATVPLDITMTAYGTSTRAGFSKRSLQQKQIDKFPDILDSVLMLGKSHRPTDYNLRGVGQKQYGVIDFVFGNAASAQ